MGEAKRKRLARANLVYHHTSILRTNLIWMDGYLRVEGDTQPVLHPQLGEIENGAAFFRRDFRDFPPVVWFSKYTSVPRCLLDMKLVFRSNTTGEVVAEMDVGAAETIAIHLDRLALGFDATEIGAIPWPSHPGYQTPEGAELNATAIDVGDNPEDWFVSENPVDVLLTKEVWGSARKGESKLVHLREYVADVHKMVRLVRETPGRVYIPPTWLSVEQAEALAASLGIRVHRG